MECEAVTEYIHSRVAALREEDWDRIFLILMGDVIDRGYRNSDDYLTAQQQLKYLMYVFDGTYVNFGNHEITYARNNPIYSFIRDIQNERSRLRYNKVVCKSSINDILTPERLTFEDFEIVFQGWDTYQEPDPTRRTFLLMHQTFLSRAGLSSVRAELQWEENNFNINLEGVEKVYCGHAHTVIERWHQGDTEIVNLGSLLRTDVKEITDLNRMRHIPVIAVVNNKFHKEFFLNFELHKREDIVDEKALEKSQKLYREAAFQKKVKTRALAPSLVIDRPMESLKSKIEAEGNSNLLTLYERIRRDRIGNYNCG
jgi:hypothetical protein